MYTPITFNEGYLEERDGHKIYYAQYGNPKGLPILSIHGGPGSKSKPRHAEQFDLEKFHVILFDQRGTGKSEPAGCLEANTTQDLVSDIERIREKIGIDSWFVSGSSWGSTLSLVYAQTHPDRIRGLLLGAIFLGDKASMDWSFNSDSGTGALFADAWKLYEDTLKELDLTPADTKGIYTKITTGTDEEQRKIALAFMNWEGNTMTVNQDVTFYRLDEVDDEEVLSTKLFLHYEAQHMFLETEQIMSNMVKIKDIPAVIVHGRFDALCPFRGAFELANAFAHAKLVALPATGHRFMGEALVARKYIFESFLKDFQN